MNERYDGSWLDEAGIDSGPWFRLIAESASDHIAVLDTRGRRLYVNPALQAVLGAERARAGTDSMLDVHAEDRARIEQLFAQIVADGRARRTEYRAVRSDGEIRHIESQANTILDARGRVVQVVVVSRDVTGRRRTEDALRAREMQLQAAQELANLGSWEWNVRTGEIWWSKELRAIYGVDESFRPTLESSAAMLHPADAAEFEVATREAQELGRIYDKPYRIVRPDGGVRTLFAGGRMEYDARGNFARLVGICQDITDRQWMERRARSTEERLRAVSRRLVEVQEADRRLLASELHDRVGQTLTALGLNLRVVTTDLAAEDQPRLCAQLADCMALVEDTVAAMRGVMGELRPQALDDYGLVAALRTYATRFAARTGIHVSVVGEDRPDEVPKAVQLAMFRIAQEALNNVAKHSRATAVEVSCRGKDGRMALSLLDDGIGFDAARLERGNGGEGWGLVIMRERAETAGARFDVQAQPHRGVRVSVEYPA